MRILLLLFALTSPLMASAQKIDIAYVDSLIYFTQYLGMDESKADSLILMADQIEEKGFGIDYKLGAIYGYRFKGWAYDYKGDYDKAIAFMLKFLKVAQEEGFEDEIIMAYGDLGGLYSFMDRHEEAKSIFLKAIQDENFRKKQPRRLSTFYNNLGSTYNQLGKKDSALVMYKKSLQLKEETGDSLGMLNLKTNLSSFLIQENQLKDAEKLILENIAFCKLIDKKGDLWHNYINFGSLRNKQKRFKEAEQHLLNAKAIAEELDNDPFRKESFQALAVNYEQQGQFKKALAMEQATKEVSEKILNQETNDKISELRETYNSEEKERENKLLNLELSAKQTQQNLLLLGLLLAALFSGLIAFSLRKNRIKNRQLALQNNLINQQKDKLTELNEEKNSLISIVSHDLRSPFNSIALWNNILKENLEGSPLKVAEATEMIGKTASYGQQMIDNILDIEKIEINTHQLDLSEIDPIELSTSLIDDFAPAASGKGIKINFKSELDESQRIVTDASLLRRALENLISNALKFSHPKSKVEVLLVKKNENLLFKIKDYGVGIPITEQSQLFTKYGQTSASPTSDESSSGLGLSIVKRIAEELGGTVSFESELGKGSEFVFSLKY
ncbi:tetratricopeptide repeat-containing sensor histidine kinase [uncultured Arcticibacterium sp.]|uniref:tetratricopeptide repeat-containing sensor histidine kinase n=1 Tax=uncultured Arcticibacterium sp. TaxID=2173042 RepID=UPI0030FCCF54